jgi:hypothetical protein
MKICSIEGCNHEYKGHGYCNKHYIRFKKYGDPNRCFLKKSCSVDGCPNKYHGRGYCDKHYQRFIDHGDVNHVRGPKYKTPLEAYESNVIKNNDNECWGWKGKDNGKCYGILSYKPEPWAIHRYSYTIHNGIIPNGMYVLHKCDNPICSNPKHLFLGTNLDNINDMLQKGRNAKGEMLPHTSINSETALIIKEMLSFDKRMIDISRQLKVGYSLVNAIKRNNSWKHVQLGEKSE